jgi:hypothetical protein
MPARSPRFYALWLSWCTHWASFGLPAPPPLPRVLSLPVPVHWHLPALYPINAQIDPIFQPPGCLGAPAAPVLVSTHLPRFHACSCCPYPPIGTSPYSMQCGCTSAPLLSHLAILLRSLHQFLITPPLFPFHTSFRHQYRPIGTSQSSTLYGRTSTLFFSLLGVPAALFSAFLSPPASTRALAAVTHPSALPHARPYASTPLPPFSVSLLHWGVCFTAFWHSIFLPVIQLSFVA